MRDFTEGPSIQVPLIQDAVRYSVDESGTALLSRLWLDNTTTTNFSFTPASDGAKAPTLDNQTLSFEAGTYEFKASFNYEQLTQLSATEVLNPASQSIIDQQPDQAESLSFLSYSEKLVAGRERSKDFLNTTSTLPFGNQGQTYVSLAHLTAARIMAIAEPFAGSNNQTLENLAHLRPGEVVGEWRDSTYGIGGGRIPFDVNAALVPAALRAISRLAEAGIFQSDWANTATGYADIWESAAPPLFEVEIPAAEARSRLQTYVGEANNSVPANSDMIPLSEPVKFHALALEGNSGQDVVRVMHTDTAFRLFLLNATSDNQDTTLLRETASQILAPFPVGLSSGVGLLVANPGYGGDAVYAANFSRAEYHGTVVWGWPMAMMAKGLERQLGRCEGEATKPTWCDDVGDDGVYGLAKRAYNHLWDLLDANRQYLSGEVWSWNFVDGDYVYAPLGSFSPTESNIRQLWSLTFLAVTRNEGLSKLLCLHRLGAVVLGHGLHDALLLLGLNDGDGVGECLLGTALALGVGTAHDLDLDTEHTLTQEDVTGGRVDKVLGRLTGVDHEAILCHLAGDDDFAALGARLHDEAQNTVAGAAHGQAIEQLVAQRLALCDGGKTAVLDLGSVERHAVLWELETLLDQAGELADAAALLAQNFLCVGCADDDVGDGRGHAHFDAGVAFLSELALEELVQLGVEDTIGDKLSALGAVEKDLAARLVMDKIRISKVWTGASTTLLGENVLTVDKKVDDVTLWRRGVRFEGTLHLTQHHIIFSYVPPSTKNQKLEQAPPKPKELWITYPMVSFCTYRPTPVASRQQPSLRIRCRDFTFAAFHFLSEQKARDVYETIRNLTCRLGRLEKLYAFSFQPQGPEKQLLVVPAAISDNVLNYAGRYRSRVRIPVLTYLHPVNDCSISRSAQPLVGVRGNRSVQDEKLVAAVFATSKAASLEQDLESSQDTDSPDEHSAHPSAKTSSQNLEALEDEAIAQAGQNDLEEPRVYGSQQHNLIVDARPTVNALAMQAVGMGSENMDNYPFATKAYLGIDNIHVMRDSLQKVVDALKESDVTPLPPNRELLAKSGWLKHIGNLLDGTALIARQVAIHHSHVLIHCSDGWDRTSQLSALSQLCLDPYYRTMEGFIVLVEKDFLSFGHMFRHRSGPLSCEKWFDIENDRIGGGTGARSVSGSGENGGSPFASSKAQKTFENAFLSAKGFFNKHTSGGGATNHSNESHDSLHDELSSYDTNSASNTPARNATSSPPIHAGKPEDTTTATPPTKPKETSPIFHQFLDATYQLQYQHPSRFEFNERFLRRLLYHLYSCQYGTFLFDNELQRVEARAADRTRSVWDYFLARKEQFVNTQWDGGEIDDSVRGRERLLLPVKSKTRWWVEVFGRTDEEMNGLVPGTLPHTSATVSNETFTPPTLSTSASITENDLSAPTLEAVESAEGGIESTQASMPVLSSAQGLNGVMLDYGGDEDEYDDPLGAVKNEKKHRGSAPQELAAGLAGMGIGASAEASGSAYDAQSKVGKGIELEMQ
ncbi:hypothetical protein FH972_022862 [Carpinus fangiana]|uniref:Myotubularin phosphatase domain-containing protein n=1 Tax=Carpinus fangiana TaxID=176857 RepID=A0A5N6KTG5_9ROSI|nr:hypothetical protein FH972_022862 [Carpinus fangiana]